jgi:ABC-2 type transport system permease protein
MFSGFIFPIEHMPHFFQKLTFCFPARWFVTVARDQFLKGSSFAELFQPFAMMTLFMILAIGFCVSTFKENIET